MHSLDIFKSPKRSTSVLTDNYSNVKAHEYEANIEDLMNNEEFMSDSIEISKKSLDKVILSNKV